MVGYIFNRLNHKSGSVRAEFIELSYIKSNNSDLRDNVFHKIPDQFKSAIINESKVEIEKNSVQKKSTLTFYRRNFSDKNLDTHSLVNIYSDPDKFISLKYPAGWKFLDHSNEDELIGVTFWNTNVHSSPPPFIHFRSTAKRKFNPKKYLFSREFEGFTAFYNDPVLHSRQIIQEIYLRTKIGVDFEIELVVKSKDEYKSVQPKFFGMVKTIKLGEIIL